MKFKMNGGWWLAIVSAIYFIVLMIAAWGYHHTEPSDITTFYIELIWLFVCSLPLWIKPIAHFCNMRLLWETPKE